MGWMTQFVLRCAAIAEMAAGTKQRFGCTLLATFLVILVSDPQVLAQSGYDARLKCAGRAGSFVALCLLPCEEACVLEIVMQMKRRNFGKHTA